MTNRELDAAIAVALGAGRWTEHVFVAMDMTGINRCMTCYEPEGTSGPCVREPAAYSSDPVAASMLMSTLRERGFSISIDWEHGYDVHATLVRFASPGMSIEVEEHSGTWTEALARAARAALAV